MQSRPRVIRWPQKAQLLVLLATLGCRPPLPPPEDGFDVVVYVIDACRPDRLGAYGYEKPTTPNIDSLANDADAVVYEKHYVAGNWTKPSTASLFTGLYVHQHGVTNPHVPLEEGSYRTEALADDFVTLAEVFREEDFATLGLVTSHHLSPKYGFDQGFDTYLDPESLRVGDEGRNSKFQRLIARLDRPYFAYLHQNACHYPFPARDRDEEFMADYGFQYDEKDGLARSIDFSTGAIRDAIVENELALDEEDVRFLNLIYDAKLRMVDRRVVGPFIDQLRRSGRWDRTLFILTADHGEELYDHGGYAHMFDMWEEVIRVPLIVKFPKGMKPELPKRVTTPTNNIDLYPSLLSLIGRPISDNQRSIFSEFAPGIVLSQGLTNRPEPGSTDLALIEGDDKLIIKEGTRRLLFDLVNDPRERHNLSTERPERLAALTDLVKALRSRELDAPQIETDLSPEAVETLRSLGYL